MDKLSLEEFRKIKYKVNNNKKFKNFDIQKELLSYDLSDIPFEEWNGIVLSDYINLDFSKTHANIDFEIFDSHTSIVFSNFKGCNIKNYYMNGGYKSIFDDDIVENEHVLSSEDFDDIFIKKYNNHKLRIKDILNLSQKQINILREKSIISHFINWADKEFIKFMGIEKIIDLYKYSNEEYNYVFDTFYKAIDLGSPISFEKALIIRKHIDVSNIIDISENYLRAEILNSKDISINPEKFPKTFVEKNKDIFLLDKDVNDELREKYYERKLTIEDILDNIELFEKLPIENFMKNFQDYEFITALGTDNFIKILKKYPDVVRTISSKFTFRLLIVELEDYQDYSKFKNLDAEKKFKLAIKKWYVEHNKPTKDLPEWIKSMGFKMLKKINTTEDLMNYSDDTILLDKPQRKVIEKLGIKNIKKLEEETHIFSHDESNIFNQLCYYFNPKSSREYISSYSDDILLEGFDDEINFARGTLKYKKFRNRFAKLLKQLPDKKDYLKGDIDYGFVEGKFREDFPEIFIDNSVPEELKEAFYNKDITLELLFNNRKYFKYLIDKDLSDRIKSKIQICYSDSSNTFNYYDTSHQFNFIKEYTRRFGNEKFLNLIGRYGYLLDGFLINAFNNEIDEEDKIERIIRNELYKLIIISNKDYSCLENCKEFKEEHPELFVDFSNISSIFKPILQELKKKYYNGRLEYDDIRKYPQLIENLKNKNLRRCFQDNRDSITSNFLLIDLYGNENFLKLCQKYGSYMACIVEKIYSLYNNLANKEVYNIFNNSKKILSFEEVDELIEDIVAKECMIGNIDYKPYNAPKFLREKHPELFLSEDAPKDLFNYFYHIEASMDFGILSKNYKKWKPFLDGKLISASLFKNGIMVSSLSQLFRFFDEDLAIKLAIKKPNTVNQMMLSDKVEVMRKWYDKTSGKFIPDYVVMQNFSINDIDKFLANANLWSHLMKINEFKNDPDGRDAMLKLAYTFGVFDGDKRGFNKLVELLTNIPKIISKDKFWILLGNSIWDSFLNNSIWDSINKYFNGNDIDVESIVKEIKADESFFWTSSNNVINLLKAIKEEHLSINLKENIITQIYKENKDDSRYLSINPQTYPKVTSAIRKILSSYHQFNLLTPEKAHQLFGGFKLEYNPEFREFLLDNLDEILSNGSYITYIASIQKQFKEIKIANSNRKLTLDLAISYVQQNRYDDVEDGNEKVAEISAIAGYDQEDFNTLQKIYNYGKQRIFSSIPRIEGNNEKYIYEMLRLDDPLAMAIGTLTDCCQEIGNVAEVCMEHSMVDKNGRVFVIKDKEGNIVSQSWVWRNGNVLCFDNIEIPNKAFSRVDNRKEFTEEVYEIYKKASEELLKKDEEAYKNLFDEGKITKEQYNELRLGKVTVGLGYNDIAEEIKINSTMDKDKITKPISFKTQLGLKHTLYTSDSKTQYILSKTEDYKNLESSISLKETDSTLPIYNDLYEIYDETNLNEKELLLLSKLELNTKGESDLIDILEYNNTDLIGEIAYIYKIDKEKTKIIRNVNFAIIYEEKDDIINIVDIFYNKTAGDIDIVNVVEMQIRLALEQIKSNKEIDIDDLDDEQEKIYTKAMNLNKEIDIERGLKREN